MSAADEQLHPIAVTETSLLLPSKEKNGRIGNRHSEESLSAFFGVLWMALAALCFSFMTTAIRLSTTRFNFSTSAAVLLRSIVHLILSAVALRGVIHVSPLDLTLRHRRLLALRGLFGTCAMVLVFKSLSYLPAGEATAIFASSPILTMLLSKLLLKETSSIWDVACALVAVSGIWLIAEPSTSGSQHVTGAVLLLLAACFAAAGYVCVREMGAQVHFMLPVFALGAIGVPVTAALGGREAFWQIIRNHEGTGIVLIGSLAAFSAQSCLNKGLQLSKAGQGVVVKNLEVPLAYALGIAVLGERPSVLRCVGSAVVVSAVVIVGLRRLGSDKK